MLGGLALLPIDKVQESYEIIKSFMPDDPKCKQLYTYFEEQWLKNTKIETWNQFESNVRTNNRIEGFHSGLNKMVISHHPNVFLLINHLKVQQASTMVDVARLKLGQRIRDQSKKELDKELSLEILCPVPEKSDTDDENEDVVNLEFESINSTESVLPMKIQPILQLEHTIDADDFNSEYADFNYVRSLINQNVLSEISNTRKVEEDRKNQLTEQYNAAITQEDIESEVKRLWTKSKDKENRKRISKKDREAAVLSLKRHIKEKKDRSPGTDEQPNLNSKVFQHVPLITLKDYDAAFGWLEKDKSMLLVKRYFYIPSKQKKSYKRKMLKRLKMLENNTFVSPLTFYLSQRTAFMKLKSTKRKGNCRDAVAIGTSRITFASTSLECAQKLKIGDCQIPIASVNKPLRKKRSRGRPTLAAAALVVDPTGFKKA
ncbi:ac transposable element-derived [Brachionus plicatilis]|uniref:Ac transposable element-derived n=1 Tax=Brachionus plicatilis TaxID=10195 RepID=A0A3M7REL5_BRAPC|nr:ac transposable element-derived [Brachionus plicatilis]